MSQQVMGDHQTQISEDNELDKFEQKKQNDKEERIKQLLESRKHTLKKEVGFGIKEKRFKKNFEENNILPKLAESPCRNSEKVNQVHILNKIEKVKSIG